MSVLLDGVENIIENIIENRKYNRKLFVGKEGRNTLAKLLLCSLEGLSLDDDVYGTWKGNF